MSVYYNENDKYAAQWLRNLIAAGHLPAGEVDERSIVDVQADDLRGFVQCHFFAGIGGWPLALRMAGWDDARPVWSGSCPCQPFSGAGKQQGEKDKRHLWPELYRLVMEWDVPTIFGEQVASSLGRDWLVGVSADLEALDYVVGAADLCAASVGVGFEQTPWWNDFQRAVYDHPELVPFAEWLRHNVIVGAPHIRQRLYWVADAAGTRYDRCTNAGTIGGSPATSNSEGHQPSGGGEPAREGAVVRLADADGGLARHGHLQPGRQHGQLAQDGRTVGGLGDTSSERSGRDARAIPGAQGEGSSGRRVAGCVADEPVDAGTACGLADAERTPGARQRQHGGRRVSEQEAKRFRLSGDANFWSDYAIVHCTDGKARRFEPGSFPLAHGVSNRVGRLRGYGNAIVPQVAAEFIKAYEETRSTT